MRPSGERHELPSRYYVGDGRCSDGTSRGYRGGIVVSLWHWFLRVTGSSNVNSTSYGFFSGFGADIQELGIVVVAVGVYRRHKCQTCWRPSLKHGLGRVEGTHFETCHRHSTTEHHISLRHLHRSRHPEMHEHLNGGPSNADGQSPPAAG